MAERVDQAIRAAAEAGLSLTVTSGWRSHDYQQGLFDEAVHRHGSAEVARQWVLPPDESMHVRGLAVDVGPEDAAAWLAEHGWRFGLCQRYANEPWHFEPTTAPGGACPDLEADAGG
ncbi:M15 family metallopeptidase [Phytoactinopolyspora alkaliphila]|uniref:M15 family metallopeptidase n=2 Tax=Phytoactinopolyspora alkaliphila TaxID=1783498 RepID=A0A6N9YK39_9ACTN|nr:M15 family metallopeptidase [Phytoactinopolyspora alkaliphila]